jgi:hypothetical protein
MQPPEIPVEDEEWFFGDIDRRLAESKCKKPGDYLVRYSERQNKYVLTCNWNGNPKHFVIQQVPNVSTPCNNRVCLQATPPDCEHVYKLHLLTLSMLIQAPPLLVI